MERKFSLRLDREDPNLIMHQTVPVPAIKETAYRREVEMPTHSSLVMSGLDLTKLSLGAALLITRRRRPKRGRGVH